MAILEVHRSIWRDSERYTQENNLFFAFVVVFNVTSPRMTHGFT